MAGGHNNVLREDPAYIKFANLNTHRFRYFRWTGRTARITFTYALVIPGALLYLAYQTEGKFSLRNKRRGDTISDK